MPSRSSTNSRKRGMLVTSSKLSPTEQRNPRSLKLDQLPVAKAVGLMLSEEAKVTAVLLKSGRKLTAAVEFVSQSLKNGGRLFYFGAGTSGRLAVLDASECPPTFHTPPDMVQGIIAGGAVALRRAVEGAEDDAGAGAIEVRKRAIGRKDVVVGIAASGTTPFVWGAVREAKRRAAGTILICFNPHLKIPPRWRPDLLLAFDLGPEILTGSTRLKCGTATKLILNLLTTLSMVQFGKVISNLMVDVAPTNVKLRHRAARIVSELTAVAPNRARRELARNDWSIRKTVRALRPGTASQPA